MLCNLSPVTAFRIDLVLLLLLLLHAAAEMSSRLGGCLLKLRTVLESV